MDEKEKLELVKEIQILISNIHKAFGAPGDYGYDSKEGIALQKLYAFTNNLSKQKAGE